MGVRRTDVIVVGVDIGYKNFKSDWYENDEVDYEVYRLSRKSEVGDIVYIGDGMCGEYFIVGQLVALDHDSENGLGMFVHDEQSDEFKAAKKNAKLFVNNMFGIQSVPKYITLTHWH